MEYSLARQIQKLKLQSTENDQLLIQNSNEHTELYSNINSISANISSNIYNEIAKTSKTGEVLRVYYNNNNRRNQINSSELIEDIILGTTQEEVDNLKDNPIRTSDIINSWYRFSHWRDEQNLSGNTGHIMSNNAYAGTVHETARNSWSYDKTTQMIMSNVNLPVYSAFITNRKLSSYSILVRCDGGSDTDNDAVLINLAYIKDQNGIEHTIDLIKSRSGSGNTIYLDEIGMEYHWSIIYDYRMDTQFELATNPNIPAVAGGWNNNFIYLYAYRHGNHLECKCSDWNTEELLDSSIIEYSLPSEKPTNYSQEMFDNLTKMLNYPAQMGLGTHSQNGLFIIIKQKNIFDDNKIYDLVNNIAWEFDENDDQWYDVGTADILKEGHLYFNKILRRLYYYDDSQLMKIN